MTLTATRSPLQQTAATATDIWNDSCDVDELAYAIEHGAVGATANPTIVHDVWKKDPVRWGRRVRELAAERPDDTEVELAWAIVEEMSIEGARLLGADLRTLRRTAGPTLDADQPHLLAQCGADARPGNRVQVGGPEHHRQVPGHRGRDRRDGGSDLSRRVGQLHRLVLGRAGRRRGRGGGTRSHPPGCRGTADQRHGPGHHDHGRARRGLAARSRRS